MFGLGFMEILFIAIIAIIFLGPDKLPGAMVEIAKFIKNVKNAIGDVKQSLNEEVNLDELKKEALGYKAQLDAATQELQGFKNLNPINELKDAADLTSLNSDFETTTQREPEKPKVETKQKEINFKKKKIKTTEVDEQKIKTDSNEEQ